MRNPQSIACSFGFLAAAAPPFLQLFVLRGRLVIRKGHPALNWKEETRSFIQLPYRRYPFFTICSILFVCIYCFSWWCCLFGMCHWIIFGTCLRQVSCGATSHSMGSHTFYDAINLPASAECRGCLKSLSRSPPHRVQNLQWRHLVQTVWKALRKSSLVHRYQPHEPFCFSGARMLCLNPYKFLCEDATGHYLSLLSRMMYPHCIASLVHNFNRDETFQVLPAYSN